MKRKLCLCLFASLCSLELIAQSWTAEDLMQFKVITTVQVAPGGKKVVYGVGEEILTDSSSSFKTTLFFYENGKNRPLTQTDQEFDDPLWSPDGSKLLLSAWVKGKASLWIMENEMKEAKLLVELPNSPSRIKWSPDGKHISYLARVPRTEAEKRKIAAGDDSREYGKYPATHLWLVEVERKKVRQLTRQDFSVGARFGSFYDWAPNGSQIVFAHKPSSLYNDWQQSKLSLINIGWGEMRPFQFVEGAHADPFFSPDGKHIAYRVNEHPKKWIPRGHIYVSTVDGKDTKKLAATFDENVSIIGWSADGKYIWGEEPYKTSFRLVKLPIDGGAPSYFSFGKQKVQGEFTLSPDRKYMGFFMLDAKTPEEAYTTALDNIKPKQISNVQPKISKPVAETEVIQWKSTDGLEIEGVLIYPINYKKGTAVPLIVYPHGGPAANSVTDFVGNFSPYSIAMLTSQGYAVLRPNFRGSEGYGLEFRGASFKDFMGKDYEDVMAGVDYLIEQGIADPDRLGIIGWSYGGYMTTWAIGQTDRFKVAVDGAGVTNLISFQSLTDMPGYTVGYLGGEFWEIKDLLIERSPLFYIDQVQTPLLILHGENDARVPISQSHEYYQGLHRQGKTVKMYSYPRQPHGLRETRHVYDALHKVMDWLRKYL